MSKPAFRIGVDARVLLDPPCGIRRYLFNLLRALLKANDSIEYVLFSTKAISEKDVPRHDRIKHVRVPGFHSALLRPWWESICLPKAVNESKVDLFFSPLGTVPPRIDIPVLAAVHDLAFKFFPHIQPWRYRQYWNRMLRRLPDADMVIAMSTSTKLDIKNMQLVDSDRISVVWEGIDHALFRPSSSERIEEIRECYGISEPSVLFVGTREPRKNLHILVEAMTAVNHHRVQPVSLILVGASDWGKVSIDSTVPWIKILKNVSDENLVALYSCATLFAFPSLYEGFGLPVLEAMSCGTPVICSNVSSLPEIADRAALLLPPEDSQQWAECISTLLRDERTLTSMREKGMKRADVFSWQTAASETIDIFFKTIYLAN